MLLTKLDKFPHFLLPILVVLEDAIEAPIQNLEYANVRARKENNFPLVGPLVSIEVIEEHSAIAYFPV